MSATKRQSHVDRGSPASPRQDFDLAAQAAGTLTHAEQPKRRRALGRAFADALAVVSNDERKAIAAHVEIDDDAGRGGVACHVGERFLKDSKYAGRSVARKIDVFNVRADDAGRPHPPFELFGLPFERRQKTEMIEHPGTELRRNTPYLLDGVV